MSTTPVTTTGFLSSYRFEGDPDELLAAHQRLLTAYPPEAAALHIVTTDTAGLTVIDSCPDEATFREFSTSVEFKIALDDAGLPAPTITPIGAISAAYVR